MHRAIAAGAANYPACRRRQTPTPSQVAIPSSNHTIIAAGSGIAYNMLWASP